MTLSLQKSQAMTIEATEFLEVKKWSWISKRINITPLNRGTSSFEKEVGKLIYICTFAAKWFTEHPWS